MFNWRAGRRQLAQPSILTRHVGRLFCRPHHSEHVAFCDLYLFGLGSGIHDDLVQFPDQLRE